MISLEHMQRTTTSLAAPCDLTIVILTLNEELHIERCIQSLQGVAIRIVVVDSYSTDRTCELAICAGAEVIHHKFLNHASQFNWALDNAEISSTWVMKLDADETLTPSLVKALRIAFATALPEHTGYTINLGRIFLGKFLRYGALYPIRLLRIWRAGFGRIENRWMDEHVIVDGAINHIDADFYDHNLNNITWWTQKHNQYATREAIEFLMNKD
ncbi:glycosyltransferase family 2 protein, partial [Glaciimonas sp. CA11.2]|nr:glycosyltransferase family 2 protein [Glaciimonas sp. CA11.2]